MPKKPTISDVARLSGLSAATVDRVLNNRAGVSATARKRIEVAINELRYAPTALSAQAPVSDLKIDVFLSEGDNPFFAEIWRGFRTTLDAMEDLGDTVRLIGFDPYREESLVKALSTRRSDLDAVVLVGVDAPAVRQQINAMTGKGIRVVTTVSDILGTRRSNFVGIDNFAAGRTAGKFMTRMTPQKNGTFAVLIGGRTFRHLTDRYSGFKQTVERLRPDLKVVQLEPYGASISDTFNAVSRIGADYPDLAGVYLLGAGNAGVYQALRDFQAKEIVTIAHELTTESRRALELGDLDLVIAQEPTEIARDALLCAMGRLSAPKYGKIRVIVAENIPE